MHDNKVSEKAIWEGTITPDEPPITASQMPHQPQMMFCYKCNQVIPSNSTYCPYCQVKLFTECPKCGAKYSSQYPSCSQCGTNRQEYLREEIIRQEKLKRERQNKERYERLRKQKEEKAKEAYIAENAKIMETEEYKSARELFLETNNIFEARKEKLSNRFLLSYVLPFFFLFLTFLIVLPNQYIGLSLTLLIILGVSGTLGTIVLNVFYWSDMARKTFFLQYISKSNGYNRGLINRDLIQMVNYQGIDKLSDCCVVAYREKHNLSINYKWHNLK